MGGRATLRDWRHSRPFCHWGLSREVASDGIPCAREKRCRQRSHARALCEKVELRFHRTRVEDACRSRVLRPASLEGAVALPVRAANSAELVR
jgi:hypothetical protein